MQSRIHHAAINVSDFDWYVRFFQDVFSMEAIKERGEAPNRQLWFAQGIQLNETACADTAQDYRSILDHISIGVDIDPVEAAAAAIAAGCRKAEGQGAHWFLLPNGYPVELKPY